VTLDTLKKCREIATILSLVAIPIVLALAAQSFQARESEAALKKDYVTLAIGILARGKGEEPDVELRQWAVDVVDRNSPVRMPLTLRNKLEKGLTVNGWNVRSSDAQVLKLPENPPGGNIELTGAELLDLLRRMQDLGAKQIILDPPPPKKP
jgi:hypothetical protein